MTEALKWKPLRGRTGVSIASLDTGSLIRDAVQCIWLVAVHRGGLRSIAVDWWGPLDSPFEDEAVAVIEAGRLIRHLKRVGWFDLPQPPDGAGWDVAVLRSCLRKLPLSVRGVIPDYWLRALDEEAASRREARSGNVLRIAGVDIHFIPELSNPVEASIVPLQHSATLAVVPAGRRLAKSDPEQLRLNIGAHGLDALTGFLLDARRNVTGEDAAHHAMRAVTDDAGPVGSAEAIAQRVARMQQRKVAVEALYGKLFDLSPANIHVLLTMVEAMLNGAEVHFGSVEPTGSFSPVSVH